MKKLESLPQSLILSFWKYLQGTLPSEKIQEIQELLFDREYWDLYQALREHRKTGGTLEDLGFLENELEPLQHQFWIKIQEVKEIDITPANPPNYPVRPLHTFFKAAVACLAFGLVFGNSILKWCSIPDKVSKHSLCLNSNLNEPGIYPSNIETQALKV